MKQINEETIQNYLLSFDRIKNSANFHACHEIPRMSDVHALTETLMELFFPGRSENSSASFESVVLWNLEKASEQLFHLIYLAYRYEDREMLKNVDYYQDKAQTAVDSFHAILPQIRRSLKKDAEAGFAGDPAAKNLHEVILCYPAMKALSVHRVAHYLFTIGVPLVPRMMNEIIHRETGIDIHPGAQIGDSFFIDHGTGVVIGETAIIGENVKLYQGVTLGSLSFPKDGCGLLIRGTKRHPTIKDNVTIYANATILGDITIGEHSTIGSSVWIKSDVPPYSRVLIPDPEIIITQRRKEAFQHP